MKERIRDLTKGGYYPDTCPTVNTTTQIKSKKTGKYKDFVFANPPGCKFPFNYRGKFQSLRRSLML